MGKQVSFDIFAGVLYTLAHTYLKDSKVDFKWAISISSAFLASVLACLASQPGM